MGPRARMQEVTVAPTQAAVTHAGGKLSWQRIVDQPLKLKACVDYDETLHGVIRQATRTACPSSSHPSARGSGTCPLCSSAGIVLRHLESACARNDVELHRRLGLEAHVVPKQAGGVSLLLILPVKHHVALVAELARRVPTLEFAEPQVGFWEKVFARAAAATRRQQP